MRKYTVDSGPIQVTSTSQTALLMVAPPSNTLVAVEAYRFWVPSGSSFPANSSVSGCFARATNTPAGGTTITPTPKRAASGTLAAQSVWTVGPWSTAPTAPSPTAGGVLWGQGIAFTAGSNWGDWVTPGSEDEIAPSGFGAFFITCSNGGTATAFQVEVVFGE